MQRILHLRTIQGVAVDGGYRAVGMPSVLDTGLGSALVGHIQTSVKNVAEGLTAAQ